MRISAKGRYALAAAVDMARQHANGAFITLASISERLGISKIYLEQVFVLLKRDGLVLSTKGAQGGYQLARSPREISALDVLLAVEAALFDRTDDTAPDSAPAIEAAMRALAFEPLDAAVRAALKPVTLERLVDAAAAHEVEQAGMFYI